MYRGRTANTPHGWRCSSCDCTAPCRHGSTVSEVYTGTLTRGTNSNKRALCVASLNNTGERPDWTLATQRRRDNTQTNSTAATWPRQ